jgi:hypothetical protein
MMLHSLRARRACFTLGPRLTDGAVIRKEDGMRSIKRWSVIGLCTFLVPMAAASGQQFSEWSAPVNLGPAVNVPAGDFFPTISKDGLSLYFTSSRLAPDAQGGWDIYVSQRASITAPWGPARNLGAPINTTSDEGAPSLSVDGHRMYFASTRPGGHGRNDIYVSRRRNKRDDFGWQPPENLGPTVNTTANEASPATFEDATGVITLYFDSHRSDGFGPVVFDAANNGNDIYSSVLLPDGTFTPAQLVGELSTTFFERQPAIRRDGLEMFFGSDRPGGIGGFDLWVSTRATPWDPWGAPQNLGSVVNQAGVIVNGQILADVDTGPAISFDGTALYFHSNRPGGVGAFDVYVARRTKLKGQGPDGNQP